MPLEPEDRHHLRAAEGYAELGISLDAKEELEQIQAETRQFRQVLTVRLQIYQRLQNWELMQVVSSKLVKRDRGQVQWAVSWAYATRRAESIADAKRILLHALDHHGREVVTLQVS